MLGSSCPVTREAARRTHRHSLAIQRLLEDAFSKQHCQATKTLLGEKGFDELLLYAANFLDQGGPYTASNRKYVLKQVKEGKPKRRKLSDWLSGTSSRIVNWRTVVRPPKRGKLSDWL